MKKNILLTGANGFIGKHLYEKLSRDYRVIRVFSKRHQPTQEGDDFSCDLTNTEDVAKLINILSDTKCYAIIHLAAKLCPPGDCDNIDYFHDNNQIALNMVKLVKAVAPESFINFSSLAVYPNRTGIYTEDSIVDQSSNTECLYGLAKFNSEVLFNFYLRDKTITSNMRLTQCYGPGMQEDRLVRIFANDIEKDSLTLFGNGERISNFIHIDDVCKAIATVLGSPKAGIYNLGCHHNISYLSLARKIAAAMNKGPTNISLSPRGVTAKVEIACNKFEKAFGMVCAKEDFYFLSSIS